MDPSRLPSIQSQTRTHTVELKVTGNNASAPMFNKPYDQAQPDYITRDMLSCAFTCSNEVICTRFRVSRVFVWLLQSEANSLARRAGPGLPLNDNKALMLTVDWSRRE